MSIPLFIVAVESPKNKNRNNNEKKEGNKNLVLYNSRRPWPRITHGYTEETD
jgi:hypothetical protein